MSGTALALRPYQREAIEAVEKAWANEVSRPAIILPTGSGKTITFAHLADREWRNGGRTLVLAHREELVSQAASKIADIAPGMRIGIEMANRQADLGCDVVVASVPTMASARRRKKWPRDAFSVVVVDEAHHALASTYVTVMDHFGCYDGRTRALGVTATMARGDGAGLGSVWQEVVYERSVIEMIAEGYLVNPRGLSVQVDVDFSQVKNTGGDYSAGELGAVLHDAGFEAAVVQAYTTHAPGRPGLVFTPTVATAQSAAAALRSAGYKAEAVWGEMDPAARKAAVDGLRDGKLDLLVNCAVLTEGTDIPRAEVAIMARPTQSGVLYCFDSETEVLTPDGWVLGRTVRPGDTISTFDPETSKVAWDRVLARVERDLLPDERMMAIETPTVDVRVTNTHRMVWMPRGREEWCIDLAEDVARETQVWKLPAAGHERFPGVPLTDDDLSFIAWVQTDGSYNRANRAVSISQQRPEQIIHIEKTLDACGFKWRRSVRDKPTNFGRRRRPIHEFRVSYGKPRGTDTHLTGWGRLAPFLPKFDRSAWARLGEMSADQWRVFLDAWHRGDGRKAEGQSYTRRSYHLAIADKWVADWVQAQCMRRGWRANVAAEANLWVVHCREVATRAVGGTSNKDRPGFMDSPTIADEKVWCVSVPSGAILTRRNGKGAIVGQCQMAGRVLRQHPGKTDALILDIVGITANHRLCTLLDLAQGEISEKAKKERPKEGESLTEAVERVTNVKIGTAAAVNLFGSRESVWLQTHAGYWFVPAGGGQIFLREVPGDRGWNIGWMPREGAPTPLAGAPDLELAMALGEEKAERAERAANRTFVAGKRDARWRSRRPSEKAIESAGKWGIAVPPEATAGEVSDLISVEIASARIDRYFGARNRGAA